MQTGKPNRKKIGSAGESYAADFLTAQGYQIIDANVRPLPGLARGEIDIIAWDGDVLCFVEVKTRRSPIADPAEAITPAKRKQLFMLAEAYLSTQDLGDVPCRFDVVRVTDAPHLPSPQLTLQRDAFSP